MTVHISIPPTLEGAKKRLTTVDGIVTASQWERAAIVAAYVTTSTHGGDRTGSKAASSLAPHEFARLGITGLRSKDTVRRYHDVWMDLGIGRPTPGEEFDLDDVPPWKSWTELGIATGGTRPGPKEVGEAVRRDPKIAKAAAEALSDGGAGHLDFNEAANLVVAASDHAVARVGGNPAADNRDVELPRWIKLLHRIRSDALSYREERATLTGAQARKADEKASDVINSVVSCLNPAPADLSEVESS